ncbi:MAG: hypothetical protein ACTS8S_19175, partial [Giesbergeria sp.]
TWYSAAVLRTATSNAAGVISGDATGQVDHPSSVVVLRPAFMPDPGTEIQVAYTVDEVHTEVLTAPTPDIAGFVTLTLAEQPAAGTLAISWATQHAYSPALGKPPPWPVLGGDINRGVVPATVTVPFTLPHSPYEGFGHLVDPGNRITGLGADY